MAAGSLQCDPTAKQELIVSFTHFFFTYYNYKIIPYTLVSLGSFQGLISKARIFLSFYGASL